MDSKPLKGSASGMGLSLADAHEPLDLKRLAFIPSYSTYYSRKVAALYSRTRSQLPSALQPRLEAVETRFSAVGSPLVHALQSRSELLLSSLDRKVGLCSWGVALGHLPGRIVSCLMQQALDRLQSCFQQTEPHQS